MHRQLKELLEEVWHDPHLFLKNHKYLHYACTDDVTYNNIISLNIKIDMFQNFPPVTEIIYLFISFHSLYYKFGKHNYAGIKV